MNRLEQIKGALENADSTYTLSLISGKYKIIIIYCLAEYGIVRFNEMKRMLPYISFKMLSSTLKDLEADKLVYREEFMEVPPRVEYRLTERGKSLLPLLDGMSQWGKEHRSD
ncbi:MAG: helix-turn-helix transcriptional regulator [Defluviitaleaceae bacterium]|nr:helix-turn-helix transcriptional regulator [Defluviitaleaceae bacterium]